MLKAKLIDGLMQLIVEKELGKEQLLKKLYIKNLDRLTRLYLKNDQERKQNYFKDGFFFLQMNFLLFIIILFIG